MKRKVSTFFNATLIEGIPLINYEKSLWIFLFCLLALATGCSEKNESSVAVNADYLHLTGKVLHGPGNPVENANIYIMGLDQPIAQSGVGGAFQFTVADTQLIQVQALARQRFDVLASPSFNLLFDIPGDLHLMGISRPVALSARGSIEIGDVSIGLPSSVTGKVTRLHGDGDFTPEAGVKVWLAGQETLTSELGHFAFTGLPAGSLQAYMLRKDQPAVATELVLDPGEDLALPYPLVILPSDEVTGWLSPLPAAKPDGLVAQSHPYRRSLKLHASPLAKYIRYHHDESKFGDAKNPADWLPVRDKIHYDFPNGGVHKLYFQFANKDRSHKSDIRILSTSTDIFTDTTGLTIETGTGLIRSNIVSLQIDVPQAATEMRLAPNPVLFTKELPWIKAQEVYEYSFDVTDFLDGAPKLVELYVQFRRGGLNSEESVLYRASATLQPFDGLSNDIFTIGDGSGTSKNRLVDISIDLPENAWEMRLFVEQVDVGEITIVGGVIIPFANRPQIESNFIRAQKDVSFLFLSSGRKTVFLQLRDKNGLLSPIYEQQFFVNPFDPDFPGFRINDGSPTTLTRTVSLELFPPVGATGFRTTEKEVDLELLPFQVLKPNHSMVLSGPGLRTVYVQYQDIDGNSSYAYSQTIYVDPFVGNPGEIILNQGDALTMLPGVDIEVFPPLSAKDMQLSLADGNGCGESKKGNSIFGPTGGDNETWVDAGFYGELILGDPGPYVVCAQFRTANGDVGNFIQQSIIYDPFPDNSGAVLVDNNNAVTMTRNVNLTIDLAPAAHRMRISDSVGSLLSKPFTQIASSASFFLPLKSDDSQDRNRTVYLQFESVDGFHSAVFEDSIILDLFPTAYLVALINSGAATTNDPTLSVSLFLPPSASGIQIAETLGGIDQPTLTPHSNMTYTLNDTAPGVKTLYFRYVSPGGKQSTVFTETIELTP